MKPLNKTALILALGISLTGLAACGGGGKKDDDKDDQAQNGFPADFQLYKQDGVWKVTEDIDFTHTQTISTGGDMLTATIAVSQNSVYSFSVDYVDDNTIRLASCNDEMDMPEVKSLQELENALYFQDTGDNDPVCINEHHTYTRIDDASYKIEVSCDNDFSAVFTVTRLSQEAVFNTGSLLINAPGTYPSLDTQSGVCGARYEDQTIARLPDGSIIQDQSEEFTEIHVAARDYGPAALPVMLYMEFNETPEAGVSYTASLDTGKAVDVSLVSNTFDEFYISATGGTVTITAITDSAVSGTFDLQTDQGNFSGSFDYDLNQ